MKLLFSLFIIVSLFFISAKSPIYATSVCGGGTDICSVPTKTCTTSNGCACNPSTLVSQCTGLYDSSCGCITTYNNVNVACSGGAISYCGTVSPCVFGAKLVNTEQCYVINDACTVGSQCSSGYCCAGSPNYCSNVGFNCAGNSTAPTSTPTPAVTCTYDGVRCGGYDSYSGGAGCGGLYQDRNLCSDGTYRFTDVPSSAWACNTCSWCAPGSGNCAVGATTAPTSPPTHYACTGANNTCVVNLYGGYTTSNCNNACPAPTSPPRGPTSTPSQICVPNSVISTTCSTTPC